MNIFKDRINSIMDQKKLRQVDLVNMTGISKSLISDYVNGKFIPKDENLEILSKALEVDANWLVGIDNKYILKYSGIEYLLELFISMVLTNMRDNYISIEDLSHDSCIPIAELDKILSTKAHTVSPSFFRLACVLDFNDEETEFIQKYLFREIYDFTYYNQELSDFIYTLFDYSGLDYDDIEKENKDLRVFMSSLDEQDLLHRYTSNQLTEYINMMGYNYKFISIEVLYMYYYLIPSYYSMGVYTLPLDIFDFSDLDLEHMDFDMYLDMCAQTIKNRNYYDTSFEHFSDNIYEIITEMPQSEDVDKFLDALYEYATFLSKRDK